ncbi:opine metallophore biosynthesis dehydrogenase, partial [Staphylococcus epidermidis]|uniref:opine metallophore biosynthesis dehydrogenase n=1 Tax=Staphylococcus epidermidis TaxID=1282 RepID=UPI0011A0D286
AYFDFFVVGYKDVDSDEEGVIHIGGMGSEDYYGSLMIEGIGRGLKVGRGMIERLLLGYESRVKE